MLIVTDFGSVINELAVHKTPTVVPMRRDEKNHRNRFKYPQDSFTYFVVKAVVFTAAKGEGQSNWTKTCPRILVKCIKMLQLHLNVHSNT